MDFRILLVITPIIFSWIFTVFWLGRWDVFRLTPLGLPKKGVAPFKNYQVWEDSALIPDTGRPAEGYPVFTVRPQRSMLWESQPFSSLEQYWQCSLNLIKRKF